MIKQVARSDLKLLITTSCHDFICDIKIECSTYVLEKLDTITLTFKLFTQRRKI